MKRRRVAIIGAGFSGVALAAQLARRGREAPDVLLIERSERVGRGVAYATGDRAHLLNVRAGNMSAFADRPDDFVQWLKRNGGGDGASFAARGRFGAYVEDVARRAGRGRLFSKAVRRVRGDVVVCAAAGQGWSLSLGDGRMLDADTVVLATGHAKPSAPQVFADRGVELLSPWDVKALRALPRGDVLLLGAGLTMVDVALSLAGRRKTGVIYALSRRGLTPREHLDPPRPAPGDPLDLPLQLSQAVLAFRQEAERMAQRGEPWQLAVDRLRARTPDLWRRLPLEAQQRFLRHLRPWWDVHRHRAAPQIAERVAALRASGKLRVLAGEVVYAARSGRGVHLQHRQRGSLVRHNLDLAAVINCTGANPDVTRSQDPVIRQLLADGAVRPNPNGMGFDVDGDCRLIDAQGVAQRGLFAIGPITQGAFWECTAVPEIRARAAALADII